MAKRTKIEPIFDEKRDRWRVDVPATIATDGKRYKAWFKTRDLAREYLLSFQNDDTPAASIPPSLAMKADEARDILEPWNLDLVQAAREVNAALEALNGVGTILEAAKAFRARHDALISSKPFCEAVALYLDARMDLRVATLASYKYTLEKVFAPLKDEPMADIETADIEAILTDKGNTSRRMHTRNLKAFWKWASSKPRQWVTMEPVSDLEAVRGSSDADIVILKLADVKSLLQAAEAESPAAAAAYAIAVYGGVRMAELGRLTWGCVGEDHIEIGAAIAKKHSRRLIPICPTLRAWLDATRCNADDDQEIVPPNWIDVSKSVRRRAGWNVTARLLQRQVDSEKIPKLPKPIRGEWPANACRHTCASVQVAIGTPLDDLTFKFGHSGGHDLLRRHYVSRITKKDAIAILSIGPKGTKVAGLSAA